MQTSYFGYTLQLRPKDIDSNDEEEGFDDTPGSR